MKFCLICNSICEANHDQQLVEYRLKFDERPWTTNAERASNRWKRAENTKRWRKAFMHLALASSMPRLQHATFIAYPFQHGSILQDVAACNPAVKAAIDGIVDAGIIPDDTPAYCRNIIFMPPQRGENALVLAVVGQPLPSDD